MKNIPSSLCTLFVMLGIFLPLIANAQTELVLVQHKIYAYFETLSKKGIIDYDNGNIPISRSEAASLIKKIESSKDLLTSTEKKILDDLTVEFSYDLDKNMNKSISLFSDFTPINVLNNDKQKYLVAYTDENASLFLDGTGFISDRDFNADSFAKTKLTLGQIGIRLRGSLYQTIGYYLRLSNGQQLNGDSYARMIAARYDPILTAATSRFIDGKYSDSFEGYLRYESETHAFALTLSEIILK